MKVVQNTENWIPVVDKNDGKIRIWDKIMKVFVNELRFDSKEDAEKFIRVWKRKELGIIF